MRKHLIAVVVLSLVLLVGLKAQDIPDPCFPCAPEPIGGCAQCHTWARPWAR